MPHSAVSHSWGVKAQSDTKVPSGSHTPVGRFAPQISCLPSLMARPWQIHFSEKELGPSGPSTPKSSTKQSTPKRKCRFPFSAKGQDLQGPLKLEGNKAASILAKRPVNGEGSLLNTDRYRTTLDLTQKGENQDKYITKYRHEHDFTGP